MYQKRIIEAITELENIQVSIRQAHIDPSLLHGTALDLDESDGCADLIDEALDKLESALNMISGD
jgi:hypothetical protein